MRQHTRQATVVELQSQIRAREKSSFVRRAESVFSSGCTALDALFPAEGIQPGSLVEWIGEGTASGAGTLSLLVCRHMMESSRPIVIVDSDHEMFSLALAAVGFDLSSIVLVRPNSDREALWACEESLRCPAVGVLWARLDHLPSTAFRRLKLAAEESNAVGFLIRSASAVKQPSWADARLMVYPRPSQENSLRFHMEVIYSHGTPKRRTAHIEMNSMRGTLHEVHETDFMPISPQLVHPTATDLASQTSALRAVDQRSRSSWRLRLLRQ
jgi:protein ImuA